MIWQDYVIMVICYGFGFALILSIRSPDKPSRWTSLLTGSGLVILAGMFATLGLWLSFSAQLFCAAMWFILLVQVIRRRVK